MGSARWARWRLCGAMVLALAGLFAGPPAVVGAVAEQQPTEQQVAAARERARQLRTAERQQAEDVSSATVTLQDAATASALALERYRAAAEARRDAMADLAQRETALARAEASVARARAELERWVRATYVDGGTLGTSPGIYTLLLGGSTADVATHRAWLDRVGRDRADVVAGLHEALEERRAAIDVAQRAAGLAGAAAAEADATRAARDAVLAEQRRRVIDLQLTLADTRRAAAGAERSAADLFAARMSIGAYPAQDAGGSGNRVTGPVGGCAGGDVSAYGNGRIPPSALCPLSVPSGGLLRADAAYAFNRLAVAYATRFGRAPCVVDAYRSYEDQVRVRGLRPGAAAAPGRSHHGWGTAVDLCGGVERFASAEHAWMRLNAPLFAWFHPAWAQRDGTLPEPWHWEFAG